jgi:hypothetical protein
LPIPNPSNAPDPTEASIPKNPPKKVKSKYGQFFLFSFRAHYHHKGSHFVFFSRTASTPQKKKTTKKTAKKATKETTKTSKKSSASSSNNDSASKSSSTA